ncbi:MAG: glycoside hydrolase family 18 protein [Dysgonamonadaceae bacterium]|jgi:chitinase|nr:glycoside hydrolase family 18 protein [Dysgonamonadaceae bacterium]
MKFVKIITWIALAGLVFACKSQKITGNNSAKNGKVIVAYVTSWSSIIPDPAYFTHINYAFGHVSNTFDGVGIANENRLKQMVELKKQKPSLKILLSIGGWGSGRFSEMAADENYRRSFAKDCKRIVDAFGLDGIDIDWEYPTADMAGISASPADKDNFTLMMKDIREEIGKDKLLTLATAAGAQYIDFTGIDPYIDFVNIMSYDMGNPPYHHSGLYRSEHTGGICVDEAVKAHINAGVPASKLVMGIPFYGRGRRDVGNFSDYKKIIALDNFERKWDDVAKAPYLSNDSIDFVCGYDDPRSIAIKCEYIIGKGMLGAMYWDYDGDDSEGTLRKAVFNGLNK